MSRTKVFQAREKSGSMKGTIPSDVVSALKLKHDDSLDWEITAENGKIVVKVTRAE
jgi:antitoxin component of MazEF toxin-antitoxin module